MEAVARVLPLIVKGIGVASTLIAAGQNAAPAWRAIKALITHAEAGSVTDVALEATESDLDALIDRFNRPI